MIEVLICYFSAFAALGKLFNLSVHQFSGLHGVAMRVDGGICNEWS